MKKLCALMLVAAILLLGGCTKSGEGSSEMGILPKLYNWSMNFVIHNFTNGRTLISYDDQIANAETEKFMEAIQEKDKDMLRSLFAKNALAEIDDFDALADNLFQYYQGETVSWYDPVGPDSSEHMDHGKRSLVLYPVYEIVTTEEEYRMTLKYIHRDDWEPDNIEIWSVCFILKSKDTDLDHPYWIEPETAGIFFDVPRPPRMMVPSETPQTTGQARK